MVRRHRRQQRHLQVQEQIAGLLLLTVGAKVLKTQTSGVFTTRPMKPTHASTTIDLQQTFAESTSKARQMPTCQEHQLHDIVDGCQHLGRNIERLEKSLKTSRAGSRRNSTVPTRFRGLFQRLKVKSRRGCTAA